MEWNLQSLTIEKQTWGEFAGKYVGQIKFTSGQRDAFMFNLTPEQSHKYLQLIAQEVAGNASELGEKIAHSMKELPNPTIIQIEAKE